MTNREKLEELDELLAHFKTIMQISNKFAWKKSLVKSPTNIERMNRIYEDSKMLYRDFGSVVRVLRTKIDKEKDNGDV